MLLAQMNLAAASSSSNSSSLGGGGLLLFTLNLQSSGSGGSSSTTVTLDPHYVLAAAGSPFSGDFPKTSPGETEPFGIDFAWKLLTGDTVASVSAALTVHYGIDPTPSARLSGSPGVTGSIVSQALTGLLPGVVYNLVFTVVTASGRVLVNFGRVACIAIS